MMTSLFAQWSRAVAHGAGSITAFLCAAGIIVVWLICGPIFGYSDTWQLVINTATTIITFLMVFLIQNTQNRDAKAVHLKLDELIRAVDAARNQMIDIESLTDEELLQLERKFTEIRSRCAVECREPDDPAAA